MVSIGPKIGVQGEREFRAAFREITAQARLLNAEMEKLTQTFSHEDSAMTRTAKVSEQLTKQIKEQDEVTQKAAKMKELAIQHHEAAKNAYEREREKLAKLTKEHEAAGKELEELKKQYGTSNEKVKEASKAFEKQTKELNDQTKKVEDHRVEIIRSREVIAEWTRRETESTTEAAKFRQELEKQPHVLEQVGGAMEKAGGLAESFGGTLTKYVTTPLLAMGTYALKSASDVTDGMAKIYTISKESQLPMSQMKDQLIELSDATGYAMDDLTEAAYQAVSASVPTEKAADFMADAAKLARGGFTTTTQAVDLLTTVINAYGMEAEDAAYISDILLKTQNDGKTIVDELARSMGTVIPTAANYHISLEQLAGAYATMTKQGVNTARATTFMNAMFTELEKEGSDVSDILEEETGKSFAQLMDSGMSLADVLKILYDHVDNDTEEFQKLFGNIRSGKAAAALIRDDFNVLTEEIERMGKATGQTEYALRVLETPSLKARKALNRLKNTAEDLGEVMLDRLLPYLEKVVDGVEKFSKWFRELDDVTKNYIINIGLAAASAGPLLKVFGKLLKGGGKLVTSFGLISKEAKNTGGILSGMHKIIKTDGLGFEALAPAVGAVTTAFVALGVAAKYLDDSREAQAKKDYELNSRQKELIETSEILREKQTAMAEETQEEVAVINANADAAAVLKARYNNLVDENGKVKEGSEDLAKVIKEQLADALGIEYDKIDDLIEKNGKFGDSIDAIIEKQKIQALMEAYKDDYVDALKRRAEQTEIVTQLQKDLNDQDALLKEAEKELSDTINNPDTNKNVVERGLAIKDAAAKVSQYSQNVADLRGELEQQAPMLDQTNAIILNYENLPIAAEQGIREMAIANEKLVMGFLDAEHGSQESLHRQTENIKKNLDDARQKFERGGYGVTKENVEMWEQLLDEAQVEEAKYWHILRETGEKSPEQIAEGLEKNKDKLREAVKKFGDDGLGNPMKLAAEKAVEETVKTVGGVGDKVNGKLKGVKIDASSLKNYGFSEMFNIGKYWAEGLVKGIESFPVKERVREWAGHVPWQTRQTLQESSPSKLSEQYGMYWGMGLINGMEGTEKSVSAAAVSLANGITGAYPMMYGYTPNTLGYSLGTSASKSISAPISVNVTVNGNVDNYDELAETIADKINEQIIRKSEVFA